MAVPEQAGPSDRAGTLGPAGALDRAAGALYGLAVGDALGMPTQTLPFSQVQKRYGWLTGFEPASHDHPLAAGMPAGSVTDDTGQALVVARLLLAGGGRVDAATLAAALGEWEDEMRRRGSLDLLGPSTRRALADLAAGVPPERSGRSGTTNGAAMRVAPVGVAVGLGPRAGTRTGAGPSDVSALVDAVVGASAVTHGTSVALAGAAAVAGAVSAGVAGAHFDGAVAVALAASAAAARRGVAVAAPDVARRVAWAVALVAGRDPGEAAGDVVDLVGTGLATHESVPAAFAVVALHRGDPWAACRYAASLGGDSDTVAAMAGAVAGACRGAAAIPAEARRTVDAVNGLDLGAVAAALLRLRETP